MTGKHLLIVEDEVDIRTLLKHSLAKEGFRISELEHGSLVLPFFEKEKPDLLVLDIMLPGLNGYEVCRTLKSDVRYKNIPILMLTAKGEDSDVVAGFEIGADDYVTKPFSPKIVVARVRALLRRDKKDIADDVQEMIVHGLTIHLGRHEVIAEGKIVALTYSEFEILLLLARKPGWVFSRYQIVDAVRGENYAVTERAIDVQIVGLRKKLGVFGDIIETVRGVGYRMRPLD